MYIMLKDKRVLFYNPDYDVAEVINGDFLPVCMRGKSRISINLVKRWVAGRITTLKRTNAVILYNQWGSSWGQDKDSVDARVEICEMLNGVNIQDMYWVKRTNEQDLDYQVWKGRLLHCKDLSEMSLWGWLPKGDISRYDLRREMFTKGRFKKAWILDGDVLYLLKSDSHTHNINTRMEVLASDILNCFEAPVKCVNYIGSYTRTDYGSGYVSKCRNFIDTDEFSFVEAWELREQLGAEYESYLKDCMLPQLSSMVLLDYIIVNTDRHLENYGFYMNNDTGEIASFAPLFDFNCALVADVFRRKAEDTLSQTFADKRTLRQLAHEYKDYNYLVLHKDKFESLYEKYKNFGYVLDRVKERCKEIGVGGF